MYLLFMVLAIAAYSNASAISESTHKCEGNTPCDIDDLVYPQQFESHYQRTRRSSETDSCAPKIEEETLTHVIPGTPESLLNDILTQKIKHTRCLNEGAKCLESMSILMGYNYICKTKPSTVPVNFNNESITVPISVACECVRE
ncbi:uncharacterized protein LOC133520790 [Cydia pomonella]|uniref:uncharacterized protein LOC133520790 n=1 Tax=Cydia pomonella TaxID=82600 RepID=UPI002ADD911B|nr:uncharacterized protein LOC133520790 [Cydia pomonella]